MKIPTSDGCTWSVGDWIFFNKILFGKRGCANQLFLVVHAYENIKKTLTQSVAVTTAERIFAEGLRPSAKAIRPSATALPRAALGKEPSGNFPSAMGSLPRAVCRAVGKYFAEG